MQAVTGTGKYERLLSRCEGLAPVPTAVAHPCEATALTGAVEAAKRGLIVPLLVGPAAKIAEIAAESKVDIRGLEIVDVPHSHASAKKAVDLIREGKAEILMKGSLHTDELMSAIVSREGGLRTGRRISHVFIMDVPTYHKVLIVTDAAINIAPTLEDKVDIVQNAIDLAVSLGLEKPKVAILCAVETVTSKMPATLDAAAEASDNGSTSSEDPVLRRMDTACAYDIDALAVACGLDASRLLPHLADLELRGLVRRVGGGRFMRQ